MVLGGRVCRRTFIFVLGGNLQQFYKNERATCAHFLLRVFSFAFLLWAFSVAFFTVGLLCCILLWVFCLVCILMWVFSLAFLSWVFSVVFSLWVFSFAFVLWVFSFIQRPR